MYFVGNILMDFDSCMFLKYKLLLVVVHEYVVIKIHLDSQDSLQHFINYKIRIFHDNLAYKHVSHMICQNKPLPVIVHENFVLVVHLGP